MINYLLGLFLLTAPAFAFFANNHLNQLLIITELKLKLEVTLLREFRNLWKGRDKTIVKLIVILKIVAASCNMHYVFRFQISGGEENRKYF